MSERRSKLILLVGVLGISASAILVRFSQAPSGVLAVYRLGGTVLLLLPVGRPRHPAGGRPGPGGGGVSRFRR